jgi:phage recombination protein Bet
MTPETQTKKPQGTEASATTAIAVRPSLTSQMAAQYGVEPAKFLQTLKATVMPKRQGGEAVPVSDEDLAAFCMVAHEYGLNPFLKEIHAFPNKSGGITPMVGVDGWAKLMNRRPEFDGIEFEAHDEGGKPHSVTARVWIKGRSRPVSVTEYYSECQRGTDPWRQMPRRMLRHKALIQAVRVAFGFAGIHDEDEALDIVETPARKVRDVTPKQPLFAAPKATTAQIQDALQGEPQGDEHPPVEADNAGLNSPDPIRRADLQAVEDVKEANYAKIATELDGKRQLIGDGFTDAGITFDQFKAWIVEARKVEVKADGFAELEEVIVKKLMPNLPALIKQAKAWAEGGAK